MTFERMIFVIMVIFVIGTGLLIMRSGERNQECLSRGGTTISTPNGNMCAKIERV
jgi:hypothetical protein